MPILTTQEAHSHDSLKHFSPNTGVSCDCYHSVTNGWLIFLICYIWTSWWGSWGPLYCQNRNWGLCFLNTPKFRFWIKADRTGAVTTSFWKRVARTYLLCNKHSKTPLHTSEGIHYFLNYTLKEALFVFLKVLLSLGLCSPVLIWQIHSYS